jgi:polyisoprenoid-binding protein YceI
MTDINDLARGTWTIDPAHTTVGFVARHLMITKVRGRFTGVSGAITIAEDPLQSSVEATIDLASVDTGDQQRDAHLRSADFFDVEHHPTMAFRSTGVKQDGRSFVVQGDLTIKGVTRPVELDVEFEGAGPDPWGGTRAAFSATTDVNRKDWGLEWNVTLETGGLLVSDKIRLELDIQAVKA